MSSAVKDLGHLQVCVVSELPSADVLAVRSSADAVITGTHRLALFASNPWTSESAVASSTSAPRESSFADILSSSLATSTSLIRLVEAPGVFRVSA